MYQRECCWVYQMECSWRCFCSLKMDAVYGLKDSVQLHTGEPATTATTMLRACSRCHFTCKDKSARNHETVLLQ